MRSAAIAPTLRGQPHDTGVALSSIRAKAKLATAIACLALFGGGCTTTNSTHAKTLKTDPAQASALSDCQNISIANFSMPAARAKDPSVDAVLAQGIQTRLSNDFGPLFDSVASAEQARGLGASKDIDDMVAETSASVAATVAHAKGWNGAPAK